MASQIQRQSALDQIISQLKTTGKYGAKIIAYGTALGAIAAIGGAQIPPELQLLASGVGVNILSNVIERIAHGENVTSEEIQCQVEAAIRSSKIEELLTEDKFSRALSVVVRNQMRILTTVQGYTVELDQLSKRLSELSKLLHDHYISKPEITFNPFMPQLSDRTLLDGEAGDAFLTSVLPEIIQNQRRPRIRKFGVLITDVDDLTIINKQYGEEVGDEVIAAVAKTLWHVSNTEYAGRCGDDTFYVILPHWGIYETHSLGENLRSLIQRLPWSALVANLRVTCGIGAARWKTPEPVRDALARAALGMKKAKEYGGNCVAMGPKYLSKQESRELQESLKLRRRYYS